MKRFWNKVKKTESCWIWMAGTASGYGQTRDLNQRCIGAHRLSYQLTYGAIPQKMYVLHKCDNKLCVRPDHLFLGTQLDNIRDMINKGRQALGHHLRHASQVGELNHGAKLTTEKVREIKKLFAAGLSKKKVSSITGVPRANIHAIVSGKSWRHVE